MGLDKKGAIVLRKRFSRTQLINQLANMPACLIGMEACCGAHYLGRALSAQGHTVRLMPPQYVRPYVKSNKNDYLDAEGIAEAVQRPNMRFVPLKNDEQLDLQALHRVRDRLISRRTALSNQIRGFLLERGFPMRKGRCHIHTQLALLLEDAEVSLSPRIRQVLAGLDQEWMQLEAQIETMNQEIGKVAKQDETCRRLTGIPGVGPLVATALVAAIGNGAAFRTGRDLAAWLGLIPKQHSTGGKTRLLGIGKKGNPYLRRLFVLGAHAVFIQMHRQKHAFGAWLNSLAARAHRNVVVVALANKIARTAWAVLSTGKPYRGAGVPPDVTALATARLLLVCKERPCQGLLATFVMDNGPNPAQPRTCVGIWIPKRPPHLLGRSARTPSCARSLSAPSKAGYINADPLS